MKQTVVTALSFLLSLTAVHTATAQWLETEWPNTSTPSCFATDGNNLFVGTKGDDGVALSTDDGSSWRVVLNEASGIKSRYVYSFTQLGTTLFADTWSNIIVTTDSGAHWTSVFDHYYINELATVGAIVFAGTNKGLYSSSDSGKSWQLSYTDTSANIINLTPIASRLFAQANGVLISSRDTGKTWIVVNDTIGKVGITSIGSMGSKMYISTFLKNGIIAYVSDDYGENWAPLINGLPQKQANKIIAIGNLLVLGFNDGNVYVSADSGSNWNKASTGLTSSSVTAFGVTDKSLFLGTFVHGVWRRPLSELLASDVKNTETASNPIQCYPNPTTGMLTVSSAQSNIKQIEIVNTLGETLQIISRELSQQPIDLSQLSSGLYIVKVTTDRGVELIKIVKN
jgi:photosystem II stability/assembly factor-like uncharacterized protein